jgi:hypothetical protein
MAIILIINPLLQGKVPRLLLELSMSLRIRLTFERLHYSAKLPFRRGTIWVAPVSAAPNKNALLETPLYIRVSYCGVTCTCTHVP